MNKQQYLECIADFFGNGIELMKKKSADYASEENPFRNFEGSLAVGVPVDRAILVRMMDKIARISNLLTAEAAVKDEKIEDTLQDLCNYSGILYAYIKQKNGIKTTPTSSDTKIGLAE